MDSGLILTGALVAYAFSLIVYQKTIREAFSMFMVAHLVAPILVLFPLEWFAEGTGFLILSIGTILIGSIVSISIILALYEPISGATTVRKTQAFLVFLVLSTVTYWALLKNEYWDFYETLERLELLLIWYGVFAVLTVFIRFTFDELDKKALEDNKS
ncbi:MAG: hypothetical protein ACTTH6_01110 [Candidatus Altimarinota bacterium]